MRRSGKGSGGGLGMNKNVSPGYRTGVGGRGINKKWVSQIGASQSNHVGGIEGGGRELKGVRASPYKPPNFQPVRLGNEIAAATVCGPGGSREVMRAGTQGVHGSVNSGNPRPNAQRHPLDK